MTCNFFFLLALLCDMWDLRSPTRDWTHTLCSRNAEVLTTGALGNSQDVQFVWCRQSLKEDKLKCEQELWLFCPSTTKEVFSVWVEKLKSLCLPVMTNRNERICSLCPILWHRLRSSHKPALVSAPDDTIIIFKLIIYSLKQSQSLWGCWQNININIKINHTIKVLESCLGLQGQLVQSPVEVI